MSSSSDFELIHGQLHVTKDPSKPEALGRGTATIGGATYMQGPTQVGQDRNFSQVEATLMVGPLKNSDCSTPDLSLRVKGNAQVTNGVLRDTNGLRCNFNSSKINIQSWKGFDIQHPSREGHRLRYVCLEGPEGGVYIRGRVKNQTEIHLPDYWKDLVDIESLTVSLTSIGSHQDVIVKRWDEHKIYLQSKGGMPIDCFYHIFAERIDGEKLIVEYRGETPADYPGDSSQYSIAGYDYGNKE
jgi:hypothetical protein